MMFIDFEESSRLHAWAHDVVPRLSPKTKQKQETDGMFQTQRMLWPHADGRLASAVSSLWKVTLTSPLTSD